MRTTTSLDRIDHKILEALQFNGRLPIARLAKMVSISVSPCWQRVKRLEKAGIIRRYTAEIALDKLQTVQIVLAQVIISKHSRRAYDSFERRVRDIPEAVECYEITGQFDYHLKFIVTSMERYKEILENFLGEAPEVEKYFTYVVTRTAKDNQIPKLRTVTRTD